MGGRRCRAGGKDKHTVGETSDEEKFAEHNNSSEVRADWKSTAETAEAGGGRRVPNRKVGVNDAAGG